MGRFIAERGWMNSVRHAADHFGLRTPVSENAGGILTTKQEAGPHDVTGLPSNVGGE